MINVEHDDRETDAVFGVLSITSQCAEFYAERFTSTTTIVEPGEWIMRRVFLSNDYFFPKLRNHHRREECTHNYRDEEGGIGGEAARKKKIYRETGPDAGATGSNEV